MMLGGHVDYDIKEDHQGAVIDAVRLPDDKSRIKFTRPLYPYPLQYRYKGSGDPDDYRNFAPFDPTSE